VRADDLDVIVIGAGPSGLMAALTASQGTPYWSTPPTRFGRVVILEEHVRPGGIAAYGTLTLTNGWILKGGQLKVMLLDQLKDLPVEIRSGIAATRIRRERGRLAVDTTKGTLRASAVVVACGIFSHLRFLRFRNAFFLAETLAGQRAFVTGAARLAEDGALRSRRVLVAGCDASVETTAARFREDAPGLAIETAIDQGREGRNDRASILDELLGDGEGLHERALQRSTARLARSRWNSGEAGVHADFAAVVFDYNSYKLRPQNARRLTRGTRLRCRDGYLVTDAWGRTSVPGVWACGNAIFPLSGVLQALYSGFVAGLSCRSATSLAAHDEQNGFLPWLAVPNSAWAGWLRSARELALRV
jgi:thioredoxin reductase